MRNFFEWLGLELAYQDYLLFMRAEYAEEEPWDRKLWFEAMDATGFAGIAMRGEFPCTSLQRKVQ